MARLGLTNEDYFNLIVTYGECGKVIDRTIRCFREKYPDRPEPTRDTLIRIIKNMKDHGSFVKSRKFKNCSVTKKEDNEINVLAYFRAHPAASIANASTDLGITKSSVFKILHNFNFHPYSIMPVQKLNVEDFIIRQEFCENFLLKMQENENFLSTIIWTDECKFTKNGVFNRHNSHYWADNNPVLVRETYFQDAWSFNVFCAIRNSEIICTYIYDENLNGELNQTLHKDGRLPNVSIF